jgi:hypothetical protein
MNTFKKRYVTTLLLVGVLATVMMILLGQLAQSYTLTIDKRMEEAILYQDKEGVFPSPNGSSMGLDALLQLQIPHESNRLILYGSSSTLAGLIESELDRPVVYGAIGSMSVQTLFVMRSFLEREGLVLESDDIVKVDISPMLFSRRALRQEVLVSALEYADRYRVGSDLSVKRNAFSQLTDVYAVNSQHISKAIRYAMASFDGTLEGLFNGVDFEASTFHRFLDFGTVNTTLITTFLDGFESNNLVVELIYLHPDIQASQTGILYNAWVDEELIPYLVERNIPWIDYRTLFDVDDFADTTHLTGKARQVYTTTLEMEINDLFN